MFGRECRFPAHVLPNFNAKYISSNSEAFSQHLNLYPNPVSQKISVSFINGESVSMICIEDLTGKRITQTEF